MRDWVFLEGKYHKKVDVWQGGSLTMTGRATLIDSSLNNSPTYHMSMFLLPKTVINRLDSIRRKFFCLLCKWWWRLQNEDGIWQRIVRAKYLFGQPIGLVKAKHSDSPIWSDLLKVRCFYISSRKLLVGNGCGTRFWQDKWLGAGALCVEYPTLFDLWCDKNLTVAQCAADGWRVHFKVSLPEFLRQQRYALAVRLNSIRLSSEQDKPFWLKSSSHVFSVKSLYDSISGNESSVNLLYIWKAKIPQKIKFFMWFLHHDSILTRENMVKRKWQGDSTCVFCACLETSDHLMFECCVARVTWGVVATSFGVSTIPTSYKKFWRWIEVALPGGSQFFTLGLAAIC
ncbi:hypothetical protein PVAP13_5KG505028 [Panicum virgatum]|uniref:Reverse transcriptase zinc-binding domain-containing protein n=1 Tax=Panicum virgatum TaxID=38727 RepID=A0A8T0SMC6_PANVG|nr:hypothetical protein PVAP13_5KG505028 [Panicum virgatum]